MLRSSWISTNVSTCSDRTITRWEHTQGHSLSERRKRSFYIAIRLLRRELVDLWAAGCILYTMLSGYQPFYAPYVADLINLIKKGQYDFTGPAWDKISSNAKDLVNKLLQTDPTKRATVHVALAHDWFNKPHLKVEDESFEDQFKLNLLRNQRRLTRNFMGGLTMTKRISEASSLIRPETTTLLNSVQPIKKPKPLPDSLQEL